MKQVGRIVMVDTTFSSSIYVRVGMGFPLEIRSVFDAIQFMDAQPTHARDEAYCATYSAFDEALTGAISPVDAYDVFCALMRRRGLLLEVRHTHDIAA
jgi:hypothetical protein